VAETDKAKSGQRRNLFIIAAAVAATVAAGGLFYYYGWGDGTEISAAPTRDTANAPIEELMAKGPLPDIVVGQKDAPITIVEYASMTCPHCAHFANVTFPKLKKKYIDTGKVKLVFREFPLDDLAAHASMLARCAGPDHYMAMVEALFQTQDGWAASDSETQDMKALLGVARQAGMSKADFDKCMANQTLYNNIVKQRSRAANEFGVDSTPTFFIDGKRLGPDHEIADFDKAIAKDPSGKKAASAGSASTDQ
jgi:protein-disulfide isomerase